MNKNNLIILFSSIHLFLCSVMCASQSPTNLILWGCKNPIAEIPQYQQKNNAIEKKKEKHSFDSRFKTSLSAPSLCVRKTKHITQQSSFVIPTNNQIILMCKTNDTAAFLEIYNQKLPLLDPDAYSAKDKKGNTPLHIACKKNNIEIAKRLLLKGVEINEPNSKKETPLHVACRSNAKECVLFLCSDKRIKIDAKNEQQFTAIHILCIHNHHQLLKKLYNRTSAKQYQSSLLIA